MESDKLFKEHSSESHENHSQLQDNEKKGKTDVDSLENFLSGEISSENVYKSNVTDNLEDFTSTARDFAAEINKEADKVVDDIFDPLKTTASSTIQDLESKIFEMGDTIPEKPVEHKLDTFLSEFKTDSTFQKPADTAVSNGSKTIRAFDEIKATTQNFMDLERDKIDNVSYDSNFYAPPQNKILDDSKGGLESVKNSKIEIKGESAIINDPLVSSLSSSKIPSNILTDAMFTTEDKPTKHVDFDEKPKIETESEKHLKELKQTVSDFTVIDQKKKELSKKTNDIVADIKSEKEKVTKEKEKVIETKTKLEAEALFYRLRLDAWFRPKQLNPKVESLIYWRDPKKSGPVFAGVLVILLALTYYSLISVIAYLSLLTLTGTVAFRIYKNVVQAVQKTGDGHPFKEVLETDVGLSQDKAKEVSEIVVAHVNGALHELRRLFLVEDLIDSLKFGGFLWCLTYVGAWFNGMTLVIIAWVALFTLPKVYEVNKTQIDTNLQLVKSKLAEITSKVKASIPIGKKEEKKDQ